MNNSKDRWSSGDAYETFMGRWSRRVAEDFLAWLAPLPGRNWLEVGCGTGALTQVICKQAKPASLLACDPSPQFVSFARNAVSDSSVTFLVADATHLPRRDAGFDFIISGLVLNFIPQPLDAVRAMCARICPGGTLTAYVWDYAQGMQFLRIFWDVAVSLDPSAAHLDEGTRFPICHPARLTQLFEQAGLESVQAKAFEISTIFPDFDAYWSPFLGGTGTAPTYVASLDPHSRTQLMHRLEQRLNPSADGSIQLTARALGIRGIVAS